jgi:putative hemolysin
MEWFVVVACLCIQAFLASAEMAFVTLTRSQLKEMAKSGKKAAETLFILRGNPERTLSVIQVGITLMGALAAAVGGSEAHDKFGPWIRTMLSVSQRTSYVIAICAVVIPYTFVTVVFSELVPKTLALRNPARIALFSARWLTYMDTLFLPLVDLLEWSTKKILTIFFPKSRTIETATVQDTVDLDKLSSQARQYVMNLVGVEKKRVRDVSLPWNLVDRVELQQPIAEVEAIALKSGHTRLPVLDNGQIFGIVNTKELLALVKSGSLRWDNIVRPISKVQEQDALLKALRQMQEKRSHLSAVYAGAVLTGIVTMEDVLEEIIGEVYDEDDDGALRRILSTASRIRSTSQSGR